MALINCSECNHQMSDKASVCPKCGAPLNNNQNKASENIKLQVSPSSKRINKIFYVIGGIVLIVITILIIRQNAISEGRTQRDREILNQQRLEEMERERQQKITEIKAQLVEAKSNLAVQKDKMIRIKEWQLGRLASEREQQIFQQTKVIEQAEESIRYLQQLLSQYQ